ncbi:hypothetical protein ACSTID_24135, partial [Vibrio parahaemolyticus]
SSNVQFSTGPGWCARHCFAIIVVLSSSCGQRTVGSEPESTELLGIALPFLGHAHVQGQVYPTAHEGLDALASPGTDVGETRPL